MFYLSIKTFLSYFHHECTAEVEARRGRLLINIPELMPNEKVRVP
jgi:hypothetical protein